jgi:hypothetical protein
MNLPRTLLVVLALTVIGCESHSITETDMVADKQLTVAAQTSKQVILSTPKVIRSGDVVTITGVVERRGNDNSVLTGHVDVTILDQQGETIVIVPAALNPRKVPTSGQRRSQYEIRLGVVPPEGSSIRVAFNDEKQPLGMGWGRGGGDFGGGGGGSRRDAGTFRTGSGRSSTRVR